MRRLLLAVLCLVPVASRALAADQTIRGRELVVKNRSTPDKRKVIVRAKESASDDTLVGDPRFNGAVLTVHANGDTPSTETFNLPAASWTGDAITGFRYKDATGANGAVRIVQIKKTPNGLFTLKAIILGSLGPISIVPPNLGTDGCAILDIPPDGDSYSVKFASGNVINHDVKEFRVTRPTAEGSCKELLCGNGVLDPGEQCEAEIGRAHV